MAQTIIGDVYSPQGTIRKSRAILSGVWGFSAMVGPLLGAFIVQHLSWSVIFWVNLPIGAAAITTLLAAFLPEPKLRRPPQHRCRGRGVAGALGRLLMFALLNANRSCGWWTVPMIAQFRCSVLLLLLAQEQRSSEPLLPLGMWRDRTILAGNVGGLAIGAAMMATSAFLPTYVQANVGARRGILGPGASRH